MLLMFIGSFHGWLIEKLRRLLRKVMIVAKRIAAAGIEADDIYHRLSVFAGQSADKQAI